MTNCKLSITIIFLSAVLLIGAATWFTETRATIAATGTALNNDNFVMTMAQPCRIALTINNRTANPVYFRLNDNATTPTCSATVYDFALDQNEALTLGRDELQNLPVARLGVFCADTTPTIRIIGW